MTKTIVLSLLAGAALSNVALAADTVSRDEVRAMVAEMLNDAETRSSLLQGGGVAGYDRGFVVRSPDGDYSLKLNGLVQFRYVADLRDSGDAPVAPNANADDFTHQFQLRKTYLQFSGNIVNKDLRYNVRLIQQGAGGNSVNVDDVFAEYNYGGGLQVRAGQFRPNFLKEELNGEAFTLGVERGIMNNVFNQGRAQGISFKYSPSEDWNFFFDVTDGFRSSGTDLSGTVTTAAEFAVTGRAEWKIEGNKEDLRDYTSKVGSGTSSALGAAVHYQEAARSQGDNGAGPFFPQDKFFAWTVDGQIEGGGLGAYAAVVNTHRDGDNTTGNNNSAWGATAQGSWRWDAAPEVFVKYDWINVEADTLPAPRDNYHFVTFGFNNYYADNAAKFTIDCVLPLTPTDPGLANFAGIVPSGNSPLNSNIGLNGSTKRGEFAIRAQLQLLF